MARGWPGVLNRERLTDHGPEALRAAALDIVEQGVRAADPYRAARDLLHLAGERLQVNGREYDLREWEHVYVIGAGKATRPIAEALEDVLGERLSDGVIVLKRGETHAFRRLRVVEASHPLPDEDSRRGAREVVDLANRAGRRDLVVAAITGGSSALLTWPPDGVPLADKRTLNQLLLNSGASIREINAVRKHVSLIKGGRLALAVHPAELINLTVSDVVGDPLDYITDPTVPDTSTYQDAWETLDKYALWERIPASVQRHLRRGAEIETPKSLPNGEHTFILVRGDAACRGAARRCEELGFPTRILTTELDGDSQTGAARFVREAGEAARQAAWARAYAVIAAGETTVTLAGATAGPGGPNQEFALSAALAIAGRANTVVAAVDVDGTDGPTAAAGGLVDGETVSRARIAGLDPAGALAAHAAHDLLAAAGDLVLTGPTGTNVNDLMIWLAHP